MALVCLVVQIHNYIEEERKEPAHNQNGYDKPQLNAVVPIRESQQALDFDKSEEEWQREKREGATQTDARPCPDPSLCTSAYESLRLLG